VIIVTWNSEMYLPTCLNNLVAQTFRDFEVLVIDNGSDDGSLEGLEERHPSLSLQIERLDTNHGFATANNIGARLARGLWLALLNADAFPEPDWLEKLLQAAESHPEYSFFSSRQIKANEQRYLDGAGDSYHISGLAWRRYADYPTEWYGLESEEVFSACAAAALYSREAFIKVGGFDEDFFSYNEDVDLGFRLRLQGYHCLYVSDAVVKHVGSVSVGAQSDFALYHWQRNLIWSFVQNMPFRLLCRAIPAHIFANMVYLSKYTLLGHGSILWKAKVDAFRDFSHVLNKRRKIQRRNSVNPTELFSIMEKGFMQPYLLGHRIRKLRQTTEL
jgi:GT2 family glycosyltransferase